MKLTLALPSLNRESDETLPPLQLDTFNQILRYGTLHKRSIMPSEFYGCLWQGSLLQEAKRSLNLLNSATAAFASPVWQQMGMHQASILRGEHLNIDAETAQQFCHLLSEFYAEDGWTFHHWRNDLWLIEMPQQPDWQAPSTLDIGGQIGSREQAIGKDALQWLGKQTEIQMWLHDHPLNRQRKIQKLPEINGLWLWQDLQGSGSNNGFTASDSVWAQHAANPLFDAPYSFQALENLLAEQNRAFSDGIVFLDDLVSTAHTGDIWTYQQHLQNWEQRWFQPLWHALNTGKLKQLTISTDGANGGTLTLSANARFKFWKREKTFNGIW